MYIIHECIQLYKNALRPQYCILLKCFSRSFLVIEKRLFAYLDVLKKY